ncbi:MAG: FAD-dependent oxidoreductase [Verrucomicrobiales bacterium]
MGDKYRVCHGYGKPPLLLASPPKSDPGIARLEIGADRRYWLGMKPTVLILAAAAALSGTAYSAQEYDIVVYGGTSAGVIAASQAKQMGKTAAIVCPDQHLGGLTSGGLGWTDSGRKEVIGGLSRDFYHRLWKHYDKEESWTWMKKSDYSGKGQGSPAIDGENRTMWIFEPHAAERVYEDIVREFEIPVFRDEWLDRGEGGVIKEGARIAGFKTLSGKEWRGKMFIDATYEGDLMAAAGVTYTVGREANAQYGETLNGVQKAKTVKHQFDKPISAYRVPGDPASGLLPRVHGGDPGEDGEGDHRVQAYCFRMCLTDHPENRVPFPKPEGYDAGEYELLLRYIEAGWRGIWNKFDPIPNRKTDTNNHGAFSTDNIGMNYDYPDGSYERRKEIIKEHEVYQQGLMYFLANDPRVPADIREKMSGWGLAKDEFTDNGNWPHQIYVREARRMVSDFVVTELHLKRIKPTPRPVGMGSYNMDSHNVQRYVDGDGNARNEGDIQVSPGGPYPIDYGAIVPKKAECENLLVPVCVSSSHISFGSIRMEPVFMILGQSAATAAVMAIDGGTAVQDVPYEKLSERLAADGQVLEFAAPPRKGVEMIEPRKQPGIVFDTPLCGFDGEWLSSNSLGPVVGADYMHDNDEGKGKKRAFFDFRVRKPGTYEVRLAYTASGNRATNVPVAITHAKGKTTVKVNQREEPKPGPGFHSLGKFEFTPEIPAQIEILTEGTDGHVIVDAAQLLPVE